MTSPLLNHLLVCLPSSTANSYVIFAKNSIRPSDEVQEVVYIQASEHPQPSKLQCTNIEVEEVVRVYGVMLSKPAWCWGADTGANENGVCIACGMIPTKLDSENETEGLVGMDFVRLGLERSATAREALGVIVGLLAKHGQGGRSLETGPSSSKLTSCYSASFIICDRSEAWVLETAGRLWAAERVISGVRCLTGRASIHTHIDEACPELKDVAVCRGFWLDPGQFDFARAFSSDNSDSQVEPLASKQLVELAERGKISSHDVVNLLRNSDTIPAGYARQASQMSILPPFSDGGSLACHWFTATPEPARSLFKPFIFCEGASIGDKTLSFTHVTDTSSRSRPRYQVDSTHPLWNAHAKFTEQLETGDPRCEAVVENMRDLEANCLDDLDDVMSSNAGPTTRIALLFKHMVDLEMNFY